MNGVWLLLYDGNGRRLGQPWWYETAPEAELEAQQAFCDSEKIREAVIYRKTGEGEGWFWEKVREVRRSETGCCVHTKVNGGLEGFCERLSEQEEQR